MEHTAKKQSLGLLLQLILRDLLITTIIFYIFTSVNRWSISELTTFSMFTGSIVGIFSGWVIGRFLHEWGHYFPAKILGANCPLYKASKFGKIFEYDMNKNTEIQFAALGWGGTITHWAISIAFYLYFEGSTYAEIGLIAGGFAYAITATVIELPVIIRHMLGEPSKKAYSFDRQILGYQFNRSKTIKLGTFFGLLTLVLVFLLMV